MPASTCWQCAATVPRGAPGGGLRERGGDRTRFVAGRGQGRLERLDRHERLGEPVPDGLEARDRTTELHPLQRVGAREIEHGAARARDLLRDGAPAERDRGLPRGPGRDGASSTPRVGARRARRGSPASGSIPRTGSRSTAASGRVTADSSAPARHTTSSSRAPADARRSRSRPRRRWPSVGGTRRVPRAERRQQDRAIRHAARCRARTRPRRRARSRRRWRCRARGTRSSTASRGSARSISSHPRSARAASIPPLRRRRATARATTSRTVSSQQAALGGVHHSSLPRSRSRRAMMLRCTSAVPP